MGDLPPFSYRTLLSNYENKQEKLVELDKRVMEVQSKIIFNLKKVWNSNNLQMIIDNLKTTIQELAFVDQNLSSRLFDSLKEHLILSVGESKNLSYCSLCDYCRVVNSVLHDLKKEIQK